MDRFEFVVIGSGPADQRASVQAADNAVAAAVAATRREPVIIGAAVAARERSTRA